MKRMRLSRLKDKKKPMFVGVRFDEDSEDVIMKVLERVPHPTPRDELHITVAYSKKPIEYTPQGFFDEPIEVTPSKYSVFDTQTGKRCLVLEVTSKKLTKMHEDIIYKHGASYDFDTYKPHITLSYDCGEDFDLDSLLPVHEIPQLVCVEEYGDELDESWDVDSE